MPTSPINEVIQYLRSTLRPEDAGRTDGQLLACFVRRREPAALEVLVRRHAQMVWDVCHRVLPNPHDAEDAFQATFLVLARKAASIRPRAKVGNWLYGVAHQTALKARATKAKRGLRETQVTDMPEPAAAAPDDWRDWQAVLDQELSRLPEKYRTVIVLCDLEGKTGKEAARQLGFPQGTVASRLARGRALLAKRLARHGWTVSGGALAAWLSEQSAGASVSSSVVTSTIKAVTLVASGQAAATTGLVSANVAALTEGVVKGMLLTKLRIALAVVLGLALTVAGAGAGGRYLLAPASPAATARPEGAPVEPPKARAPAERVDPYGDPLPEGALARLGTTRFRPGGVMALAPDGRTAVTSVGYYEQTRFWDVATGKLLRSVEGGGRVICYSPDGRLVATADAMPKNGDIKEYIGQVYLWDPATGKRLAELQLPINLNPSLGFSPDSTILAVGGGQVDRQGQTHSFIGLWRWDGTGLKPFWEAQPDRPAPCGSDLRGTAVAFSADGKYLATGGYMNHIIRLWRVADGKEIRQLQAPGTQVITLAFAPTGNALASGSKDGPVVLWDLASGVKHWESKQAGDVWALAFAPDGKTLAVGSASREPDQPGLVLLDATNGKETRRLVTGRQPLGRDGVRSAAFSRDGRVLAALHGWRLRLWDGTTGKERPGPAGPDDSICAVAVSEDGRLAATAGLDCSLILWDLANGNERRHLTGHHDAVVAARFVPGGKLLASASFEHDRTVRLWDLATGKEVRRLQVNLEGCLYALAVSPDGKRLAAGDYLDGTVCVWDLATAQLLHTLRNGARRAAAVAQPASSIAGGVGCLAFSPDGKILAAGEHDARARKSQIVLWSASSGKKLRDFPADDQGVISLSFAPDGHLLASTGMASQTLDFWDVDSGNKLFDLPGAAGGVAAFAADGKTIAWGSKKETLCVWEIASRQVRRRFVGDTGDRAPPFPDTLAFDADGRTLVSAKGCTALVWDVTGRRHEAQRPAVFSPDQLPALWKALASPNAAEAGRALWALTTDPKRATPFLVERMRHLPAPADPERIRQLITELDSDDFAVRQAAERQLESFGKLAESALRESLARKVPLEVSRRITRLLQKRGAILRPPALQALRAMEVLEHVGTVEARQALEQFAKRTTDDFYRQEAQAAALRLEKWAKGRD